MMAFEAAIRSPFRVLPASASASRRSWLRLLLIVAAVAVLAAAAAGAWYLFLRPPAPAEVALGAVPTAAPTDDATEAPASEEPAAAESAAPDSSAAVAGRPRRHMDRRPVDRLVRRLLRVVRRLPRDRGAGRDRHVDGGRADTRRDGLAHPCRVHDHRCVLRGRPHLAPERQRDARRPARPAGPRDRHLPHGDVRPRRAHRARRRARRGRGDRRRLPSAT